MLRSMQTHFEGGLLGESLCAELVSKNIQHFRLSGVDSNLDQCIEMVSEAKATPVSNILTIRNLDILSELYGIDIEWHNEPDGDMLPNVYHEEFMKAYKICYENDCNLSGPCISNLDKDSLLWLEAFIKLGIPQDVIITYHHYTPDLFFWQAHPGFTDRDDEMRALKNIVWGRKIACSESGYNDTNEERVAENVIKEIKFAEKHEIEYWTYFQLNDDVKLDLHFGARRGDFTWKPVINSFF